MVSRGKRDSFLWPVAAALGVAAGVCMAVEAAAETKLILPTGLEVVAGATCEVPILIEGGEELIGCRIVVQYATQTLALEPGGVSTANTLTEKFLPVVNDTKPGTVIVSMAGTEPIASSAGVLLSLTFRVHQDVPAGVTASLRFDRELTRLNDGSAPVAFEDGTIVVASGERSRP